MQTITAPPTNTHVDPPPRTLTVSLRTAPIAVLDFETYFDDAYSLRKLSIVEYVHDRRFRVHGLAVRYADGGARFHTNVPAALAEMADRYGPRLERALVVMHNGYFDAAILAWKYDLRPPVILDTMLLSHHVYGPRADGGASASLGSLALRLGLVPKERLDFM